jgi:hypothetical protein
MLPIRGAEIAADRIAKPRRITFRDRPIEAVSLPRRLDVRRRRPLAGDGDRGIGGDVGQGEHHQ